MTSSNLTVLRSELSPEVLKHDNALVISDLSTSPIVVQMVGLKSLNNNVRISEEKLQEKLYHYDETIGRLATQNVLTEAQRSEYISAQEDITVPEGIYSFGVKTDPQTGQNSFKSRLTSLHSIVESKGKPIWFVISSEPIRVSLPSVTTKNAPLIVPKAKEEEENEESEEWKEWQRSEESADKILGQARIYSENAIPHQQYFLRKIIEHDRDFGMPGIESVIQQRKEGGARIRSTVRMKKTIPSHAGIYEYEIYNKPPLSTLYFSSRFRYFTYTGKERTLAEFAVPGSTTRRISVS